MEIRKNDLSILNAVGDPKRYPHSISCVKIEPGRIVATDGRILVIRDTKMEEGEKPFKSVVVEPKVMRALAKTGAFLTVNDDGSLKIRSANVVKKNKLDTKGELKADDWETTIPKPKEGEQPYPDYSRVVPEENRPGVSIELNVELLLKLIKSFEGAKTITMQVQVQDLEKAVRFDGETTDGRKVMGLIMPWIEKDRNA
jgi:DNA polymerase III sliding clamp (beta) subunit (PCNA family)